MRYETHNAQNLILPRTNKNYYLKSFIPSSIRLWNKLDPVMRQLTELENFKNALSLIYISNVLYKPYLWGFDKEFIQLSRLRMGLSGLNCHRKKYHFINSGECPKCNFKKEDTIPFLFQWILLACQLIVNLLR